jgi:hypothetical protein
MAKTMILTPENFLKYAAKFAPKVDKKIFEATTYAHSGIAALGVKNLKEVLSERHGASPKSEDYANAPIGEPPYMHTGTLRRSIGYVIVGTDKEIRTQVGSGAGQTPIEYAKGLDQGLHPFIYLSGVSADQFLKFWNEKFRDLNKNGVAE